MSDEERAGEHEEEEENDEGEESAEDRLARIQEMIEELDPTSQKEFFRRNSGKKKKSKHKGADTPSYDFMQGYWHGSSSSASTSTTVATPSRPYVATMKSAKQLEGKPGKSLDARAVSTWLDGLEAAFATRGSDFTRMELLALINQSAIFCFGTQKQ